MLIQNSAMLSCAEMMQNFTNPETAYTILHTSEILIFADILQFSMIEIISEVVPTLNSIHTSVLVYDWKIWCFCPY